MDVAMIEYQPQTCIKGASLILSLGSSEFTSMRSKVQLSTGDDCWRSQWRGDAVRRNHVTAKYEDTPQQTCKIYAINKYTTPDGIEDGQMNYFYIISAQTRYMLANSFKYGEIDKN